MSQPPRGRGARQVAAVLLGLGPEVASELFRLLDEDEVRQVAEGARALKKGSANEVPEALKAFIASMEKVGAEAGAGDELLREIAAHALGNDVARRAFDGELPPPPPDEVLGPIANADPEALAMVLAREQPQTIALVLSALDPERSVEVMDHLPDRLRPGVLRRMATVESVAPEVLREVGQALAQELKAVVAGGMRKLDGKAAALEILRRRPSQEQNDVMASIEEDDPDLADELRTRLFTFGDLIGLADRDIQSLIKELDLSRLGVALKGASPELKDKFIQNMSQRAGQMLAEDLEIMGPVRLSTVEEAQAEVVRLALELSDQGTITVVRPADKML